MNSRPKARYRMHVEEARMTPGMWRWLILDDDGNRIVAAYFDWPSKTAALRAGKRICREAGNAK